MQRKVLLESEKSILRNDNHVSLFLVPLLLGRENWDTWKKPEGERKEEYSMAISKHPKWQRIMLSALVAVLLAMVLSLGAFSRPSSVAHAGTNGQQLSEYTGASHMCVSGTNQNGYHYDWSNAPCFALKPGQINDIPGWWWVGQLDIKFYDSTWNLLREDNSGNVNVPQNYDEDYWYFEEAI
jgi:hypothetical protein